MVNCVDKDKSGTLNNNVSNPLRESTILSSLMVSVNGDPFDPLIVPVIVPLLKSD